MPNKNYHGIYILWKADHPHATWKQYLAYTARQSERARNERIQKNDAAASTLAETQSLENARRKQVEQEVFKSTLEKGTLF